MSDRPHRQRAATLLPLSVRQLGRLSRTPVRSAAQEAHLAVLEQEMADRLLAAAPDEVYDAEVH